MVFSTAVLLVQAQDWPNLARYGEENLKLGRPRPNENRVVFMGNSIIEFWGRVSPGFFAGRPYINRGIGGQTTPQMLVRFRADVIQLEPRVVVILAGTNDIAGNTGPSTLEMIEDNIASMVELARAHGIGVILASVLPAYDYPWHKGQEPAGKIVALNKWIKAYAGSHGCYYLDYHSAMADEKFAMREGLSNDGVHPNKTGYALMASMTEEAIAIVLNSKK
jgi:lysophospholipase L1-like esterase